MGTVLREGGFDFEIRSREANHRLPHVHVWKAGRCASISIEDGVVLWRGRMREEELVEARRIIAEHREYLVGSWSAIHGQA